MTTPARFRFGFFQTCDCILLHETPATGDLSPKLTQLCGGTTAVSGSRAGTNGSACDLPIDADWAFLIKPGCRPCPGQSVTAKHNFVSEIEPPYEGILAVCVPSGYGDTVEEFSGIVARYSWVDGGWNAGYPNFPGDPLEPSGYVSCNVYITRYVAGVEQESYRAYYPFRVLSGQTNCSFTLAYNPEDGCVSFGQTGNRETFLPGYLCVFWRSWPIEIDEADMGFAQMIGGVGTIRLPEITVRRIEKEYPNCGDGNACDSEFVNAPDPTRATSDGGGDCDYGTMEGTPDCLVASDGGASFGFVSGWKISNSGKQNCFTAGSDTGTPLTAASVSAAGCGSESDGNENSAYRYLRIEECENSLTIDASVTRGAASDWIVTITLYCLWPYDEIIETLQYSASGETSWSDSLTIDNLPLGFYSITVSITNADTTSLDYQVDLTLEGYDKAGPCVE